MISWNALLGGDQALALFLYRDQQKQEQDKEDTHMLEMRVVEAGWLLLDKPESPMHVSSLLVLKQSRPYDVLRHWRERFASFHPSAPFDYVCKRTLQHPWGAWERSQTFTFDDHIRGVALTAGENSPEHLHRLASWLHSLPLERDRPLWQLFVIEGLPDHHYAILIKIHHALTDGVFAMGLLYHMLSPYADELCNEPFWAQHLLRSGPSRQSVSWPESFKKFAPMATGVGQGLWHSIQQHLPMKWPYQALPSKLNQQITPRRHLEVCTFSLPKVMEWAHQHKATLNDVLLFLTGTALHQYLGQQSEAGPDSLNALIPVSLRSQEQNDPGCRLGFAVADLGSRDASAEERLDQVKRSTEAAKSFLQNFSPAQKQVLTSILDILYVGSQLLPFAGRHLPPVANLLVSNVVGPQQTLYFNGDQLEQIIPLSILADGQSLNVTALSYADQLFVSCVCCPDVVKDPRNLRKQFEVAWDELQRIGLNPAGELHTTDSRDSLHAQA
jgi:WS/DGAT/MGAT family acyltransferase